MTFENGAYAINGATIGAALARRALYASARSGGIVQKDDLKVSALSTAGIGIQISEGVGTVLNDYQDDPNEVYVVSNPGGHTVPSSQMPASSPAARSFIVAVVIGDPDFSQAGHPWMPSTIPDEQRSTFQYVRVTLIEVAAGATKLDVSYPALVLARLDIPANTTTITAGMVKDLRKLAQPRQSQEMFVSPAGTYTNASPKYAASTAYADWGASGGYAPSVEVPSWAARAIMVVSINGVVLPDSTVTVGGSVRAQLGSVVGASTSIDFPARVGAMRDNLQCAGTYDVSALAGTSVPLRVEAYQNVPTTPTTNQRLRLASGSQLIYDVRFFEQ